MMVADTDVLIDFREEAGPAARRIGLSTRLWSRGDRCHSSSSIVLLSRLNSADSTSAGTRHPPVR